MSEKLAPTRPYAPTVHVLVLPSQLPIDLRLTFRDMDELHLASDIFQVTWCLLIHCVPEQRQHP